MVFEGTTGVYERIYRFSSFQFQISKKEREIFFVAVLSKGTVKRATETCNLFCNIAAKAMLCILPPIFKPVSQQMKVAARWGNTDF